MTDAGWAEKAVDKVMERLDCSCKTCAGPGYRKLLEAEHARSVRMVKKARWAKRPIMKSRPDDAWFKGYETACNEILTALQRGRGGKG